MFECDTVSEIILVEFKNPTKRSLDVWGGVAEPNEKYKNRMQLNVPNMLIQNYYLIVKAPQTLDAPDVKKENL